jgi:hypothetical protein
MCNDTFVPRCGARLIGMPIVNDLLRSNEQVRCAYGAMRRRGISDAQARTKIARAILDCLCEELQGCDGRFDEVVLALGREQITLKKFSEDLTNESPATQNGCVAQIRPAAREQAATATAILALYDRLGGFLEH